MAAVISGKQPAATSCDQTSITCAPYLPGCPDALGYPIAAASFGPRAAIVAAERIREGWCWVMANVLDDICALELLLTPEMAKPPNISKATVQRCIEQAADSSILHDFQLDKTVVGCPCVPA